MDAGLVWTAAGTLGTCAGLGLARWRSRAEALERRRGNGPAGTPVFGLPVAPPTRRLPVEVRGRDGLLARLRRCVRRPPGAAVVLVGPGGTGKSTVAAALAGECAPGGSAGRRGGGDRSRRARGSRILRIGSRSDRDPDGSVRRRPKGPGGRWGRARPVGRRLVWWVSAGDRSTLDAGLVTVARQLGAAQADLEAIAVGAPDGPDRFWALLERAPAGWLLVFDNADDPDVLAAVRLPPGAAGSAPPPPVPGRGVADGTGWMRGSDRGLVLVTSRHAAARTWGAHAAVCPVGPLDEADAARVLLDLAPCAGGGPGDGSGALPLARRLGGLPLALHLAGTCLESVLARWRAFDDYRRALDEGGGPQPPGGPGADPGTVVTRIWELSLDILARQGVPQARTVLRLLSCYAPATHVPHGLLDPGLLAPLLNTPSPDPDPSPDGRPGPDPARAAVRRGAAARALDEALRGLGRVGLIGTEAATDGRGPGVTVHRVVADTNRTRLDAPRPPSPHRAGGPPGEPDPGAVRRTAAALMTSCLSRLRWDRPEDLPRHRQLSPHLHALLGSVAGRLDPGSELGELVTAVHRTARALDQSGAVDAGESLNRAALTQVPRLGEEHPLSLSLCHQHAWEIAFRGDPGPAEAVYHRVVEVRGRVLGHDHPDTLATRHELAWVAAGQGRWREAESGYAQVLEARRRTLGRDDPATLFTSHELAWTIANQGRPDEAETILRPVLAARGRVLGDDHPQTLATRHELAWTAAKQDRLASADDLYRQVLDARRRVLGEEHPSTLTTCHELAWVASLRGRPGEAKRIYRQVLDARRRVLGDHHRDTLATGRALHLLGEGRIAQARHPV